MIFSSSLLCRDYRDGGADFFYLNARVCRTSLSRGMFSSRKIRSWVVARQRSKCMPSPLVTVVYFVAFLPCRNRSVRSQQTDFHRPPNLMYLFHICLVEHETLQIDAQSTHRRRSAASQTRQHRISGKCSNFLPDSRTAADDHPQL